MRTPIECYDDYSVDSDGRVFSEKFGKVRELKGGKDKDGYLMVELWKNGKNKMMKIHRLVAIAFLPNPNNYEQVNHLNGIKTDNRLENLEWCSRLQNMQHAVVTGLKNHKGSKNPFAKLSDSQVIEIFARLDNGESPTEIAKDYPTTRHAIYLMKAGKTWTHLNKKKAPNTNYNV